MIFKKVDAYERYMYVEHIFLPKKCFSVSRIAEHHVCPPQLNPKNTIRKNTCTDILPNVTVVVITCTYNFSVPFMFSSCIKTPYLFKTAFYSSSFLLQTEVEVVPPGFSVLIQEGMSQWHNPLTCFNMDCERKCT